MQFFDIQNIAIKIPDYPISYVEVLGTLFGMASVYFASRANILTWATGIVNEIFLFILFFQVQLYADMFLQVYFFVVTLYGWYIWNSKTPENKISRLSLRTSSILAAAIAIGTVTAGYLLKNIHLLMPDYFRKAAAFPFIDSFVMVLSIIATVLLAKKKIENWYLWIAVDLVCVVLFFSKGVYFLSLEYFIFLGIAGYGFFNWKKTLNDD